MDAHSWKYFEKGWDVSKQSILSRIESILTILRDFETDGR